MSDTPTQHFSLSSSEREAQSIPLSDYTERIIESQEEADQLHRAACIQQDTCREAVRKAKARVNAAVLRYQRAKRRGLLADRYVGKIRSLIRRSGFLRPPLDSTLARRPRPPIEIAGAEHRISVADVSKYISRFNPGTGTTVKPRRPIHGQKEGEKAACTRRGWFTRAQCNAAKEDQPPPIQAVEADPHDQIAGGRRRAPQSTEGMTRITLPPRVTRGKGGAIAQLKLVSKNIRPDLEQPEQRQLTENIPEDTPVNPMSPVKGRQHRPKDPILLPRRQEPSLVSTAPAPVLQPARRSAGYGFAASNTYPTPDSARNVRWMEDSQLSAGLDDERIDPRLLNESQARQSAKSNGRRIDPASSARSLLPSGDQGDDDDDGDGDNNDDDDDNNDVKGDPNNQDLSSDSGDEYTFEAEDDEMVDEKVIDEISSDEDQRNAMKVIQGYWPRSESPPNATRHSAQDSDHRSESVDEIDVLDDYRRRNRSLRAPNPEHLASYRHGSASHNSNVPDQHAGTSAQPDNDYSNRSKSNQCTTRRAPRHSKTPYDKREVLPTKLGYYPSQWRDVLDLAKYKFLHYLTTNNPFPDRPTGLQAARALLMEAIDDHEKDEGVVEDGYLQEHKKNMSVLLFEQRSNYRGKMKTTACEIVKARYNFLLGPDEEVPPGQGEYHALIGERVDRLLDKGTFLYGEDDPSGRANNFSHPALQELCIQFYYEKPKALSRIFPEDFTEVDTSGVQETIKFAGDTYSSIFEVLLGLLEDLQQNPIHGAKLKQNQKHWARLGRMRQGKKQSNPHNLAITLN
ncbi:hypothetical protein BD779DRAFT_1469569 [Infundibulicybe gibba]|nr:hypothetical protein BD779DRAFT_1469569 [Infundibulicybe gibba]